eukprot:g58596.t1
MPLWLLQPTCITVDLPQLLAGKVDLEIKTGSEASNALTIDYVSNCSIFNVPLGASYESGELLVTISEVRAGVGSKVGVAKMSSALPSLSFGLAAGSQRLFSHQQVSPVAAILGLAHGALGQTQEVECRYILQITIPKKSGTTSCVADYSGNVNLHCSFGANLIECSNQSDSLASSSSSKTSSASLTPSASRSPVVSTPTSTESSSSTSKLKNLYPCLA